MCIDIGHYVPVANVSNNGDLVIPNLTITTASLPPGNIGSSYIQTLAATRGNAPYVWRVVAGSLPKGLHLDRSTGTISGVPTERSMTSSFRVEVRDTRTTTPPRTRNFDTATFTIAIS
jgi:Putative Ig domain